MNVSIPEKIFLTKGVGVHKERLASFELALRDAGIASCNLVYVSSILPPNCEVLSKNEGLKLLKPGQIIFCVMSRIDTSEPNRLMAASIGMAMPYERSLYGYLSEHKSYGHTQDKAGIDHALPRLPLVLLEDERSGAGVVVDLPVGRRVRHSL